MEKSTIGSKRLVVGAGYGMRDWLAQRVTAIVMAIYTLILLTAFLFGDITYYEGWAGLFSHTWFKVVSAVTFLALSYHAWVGVRDIWMDYIKPVGLRLSLQVASIAWLVGCAVWALQILWRD